MSDINAFIDHGYGEPGIFARAFFNSPDFTVQALRRILQTGLNRKKEEFANEVWRRLQEGTLDPSAVLRFWAEQPRRWLSFKLGAPAGTPDIGAAESLLTEFGNEGWHGPLKHPDGVRFWYFHISPIVHYRFEDHQPRLSKIRWTVIAEVSERYIGLSWDNFSYRPGEVIEETSRFPFWQHLPDMFQELEGHLGGTWQTPALHDLILHHLWDRYKNDPDYRWYHLRIRAERFGVALSARSAGITEINIAGLEALTKALARSAATAANISDYAQRKAIEDELLRTLLLEWGANSYAFRLDKIGRGGEPDKTIVHSHYYFGLRRNLQSQDRFQHIECFQDAGGSGGALDFLSRL